MNREIKFRGFHEDSNGKETIYVNGHKYVGEWVYGNGFYKDEANNYWFFKKGKPNSGVAWVDYIDVISETISQYIGKKDKNGKEIYENDRFNIIYYDYENGYENSWGDMIPEEIKVEKIMTFDFIYTYNFYGEFDNESIEVIGTIFDKEVEE